MVSKRQLTAWNKRMDELEEIMGEKEHKYFAYIHKNKIEPDMNFTELTNLLKEDRTEFYELDRKVRMNMEYDLSDLPDYGDVFPIKDFIAMCKSGCLIDYDGYGNYIVDDKCTNIEVYPSDVKYDSIRKDFDAIVWYNR